MFFLRQSSGSVTRNVSRWPGPSLCASMLAAVVGNDAISDRKPQAGALPSRRRVKNGSKSVRSTSVGHAAAVVADDQLGLAVASRELDPDRAAWSRLSRALVSRFSTTCLISWD